MLRYYLWNINADIAEAKLKKGVQLKIEGRLQIGSYKSKDGSKDS
jgi:single-stranded DNA-binding protein